MPNIEKTKKKKLLPVVAKTTKKKTKSKPSPVEYYNCLLTQAQNNWYDPTTGTKKKITACCRDCKTKAPLLNQQRQQELKKWLLLIGKWELV